MHTFIKIIFLFTFCFWILPNVFAQKARKIDKNYFVFDIDLGFSFANFDESKSQWRPTVYPALSLSLMANRRINARLDLDYGAGGSFYYLINKGPSDKYVLDFASPYLIAGLGYNFMQSHRQEQYVKISAIAQLGYDDVYRDVFDSYTVEIESNSKYYYSLKLQYVLRRFVKKGGKKKLKNAADEYGVLFRYSFQNLGTATFKGANYETVISPVGHIGGVYYKFLLSYGGGKVKRKVRVKKPKEILNPPIIFSPRF